MSQEKSFSNLGMVLNHQISRASKLYVASALINEFGVELLRKAPDTCEIKLLVGIDLLTPARVLRELQNLDHVHVRVYQEENHTFHPKVYLLQIDETWQAYVGSANFTKGGLETNIEMTLGTDDEEYTSALLSWFEVNFKKGLVVEEKWLEEYEKTLQEIHEIDRKKKELLNDFKRNTGGAGSLSKFDFSGQFFQYEHFNAFSSDKPRDRSLSSVRERGKVKDRLLELNRRLLPLIAEKGWNIEPHYQKSHVVSSIEHGEFTSDELRSVWLSYNRPGSEVKSLIKLFGDTQTPLYQMRLQVLVHHHDIAVHLTIGKDKRGGWRERGNIQNFIRDANTSQLLQLHSLLSGLPDSFYIVVANKKCRANGFETVEDLKIYLSKDDIVKYYFVLGRSYSPDDTEINESNITSTIIQDFKTLYPIYKSLTMPVS